jgi:hypothetical protein
MAEQRMIQNKRAPAVGRGKPLFVGAFQSGLPPGTGWNCNQYGFTSLGTLLRSRRNFDVSRILETSK